MALGLAPSIRSARAALINAAVNAGSGPGKINVYSGTQPATGAAVTSQVLLAELTFSDPAFVEANGTLTAAAITEDQDANADGTATWVRITDSDDNFVMDLDAGLAGSDASAIFEIVDLVEDMQINGVSFVLVEGNA